MVTLNGLAPEPFYTHVNRSPRSVRPTSRGDTPTFGSEDRETHRGNCREGSKRGDSREESTAPPRGCRIRPFRDRSVTRPLEHLYVEEGPKSPTYPREYRDFYIRDGLPLISVLRTLQFYRNLLGRPTSYLLPNFLTSVFCRSGHSPPNLFSVFHHHTLDKVLLLLPSCQPSVFRPVQYDDQ